MFDFTHIPDYKTAIQSWLYQVHREMYEASQSWEQYRTDAAEMECLIEKIESGEFTNEDHDALFAAINEYQLNAVDIAYLIGLKHGISAKQALTEGKITDLLSKRQ